MTQKLRCFHHLHPVSRGYFEISISVITFIWIWKQQSDNSSFALLHKPGSFGMKLPFHRKPGSAKVTFIFFWTGKWPLFLLLSSTPFTFKKFLGNFERSYGPARQTYTSHPHKMMQLETSVRHAPMTDHVTCGNSFTFADILNHQWFRDFLMEGAERGIPNQLVFI